MKMTAIRPPPVSRICSWPGSSHAVILKATTATISETSARFNKAVRPSRHFQSSPNWTR